MTGKVDDEMDRWDERLARLRARVADLGRREGGAGQPRPGPGLPRVETAPFPLVRRKVRGSEATLMESLRHLGVDEVSFRALSLLPLLYVGWAPGEVDEAARRVILETATRQGLHTGRARELLDEWLRRRPSDDYFERAFALLVELARRRRGVGAGVTVQALERLVALGRDVARATQGRGRRAREKGSLRAEALEELADRFCIDDGQSWQELLEELE